MERPRSRSLVTLAVHWAAAIVGAIGVVVLILGGAVVALTSQLYWPVVVGLLLIASGVAIAWRLSRRLAAGLVALVSIGAIFVTGSQVMAATPPIRDADGAPVAGSIATMERVDLGGVGQWLVIRGRSAANPVLLFLSGGPGPTQLAWHRQYLAGLEDHFLVVYWEQRGSGKSGGLALADWGRMTPEQYTADGLELTAYLRERFRQDRIFVAGQSWGTMLGVWMVQQRPEWFAAYVGIGQMTDPVEDDRLIYDYVLTHARQDGDAALVDALVAQGPPPYDGFWSTTKYGQLFAKAKEHEMALVEASGPPAREPYVAMTETPEYGAADVVSAYLAGAVTFARVYDQLDAVDLERQVPRLDVPVYLAEGRHDLNAMPALAQRWFDKLKAPSKQLTWFEHSGHNPEHEQPAAFVRFMVDTVLAGSRARMSWR